MNSVPNILPLSDRSEEYKKAFFQKKKLMEKV
jgi:hypothetical protein